MLDTDAGQAVRVEGLVKQFGSLTAVDDVSFDVKRGEIFGILGPNGAGKTTTLEIIEGLLKPTQGTVSVLGLNVFKEPNKVKARIGVQLQSSAYHDYLKLTEILTLLGSFYPKRVSPTDLLERVGLADKAKSRVLSRSGETETNYCEKMFNIIPLLLQKIIFDLFNRFQSAFSSGARRGVYHHIHKPLIFFR